MISRGGRVRRVQAYEWVRYGLVLPREWMGYMVRVTVKPKGMYKKVRGTYVKSRGKRHHVFDAKNANKYIKLLKAYDRRAREFGGPEGVVMVELPRKWNGCHANATIIHHNKLHKEKDYD